MALVIAHGQPGSGPAVEPEAGLGGPRGNGLIEQQVVQGHLEGPAARQGRNPAPGGGHGWRGWGRWGMGDAGDLCQLPGMAAVPWELLPLIPMGIIAGLLAGLLGIGGGLVFSPLLLGLGLAPHQALATSRQLAAAPAAPARQPWAAQFAAAMAAGARPVGMQGP